MGSVPLLALNLSAIEDLASFIFLLLFASSFLAFFLFALAFSSGHRLLFFCPVREKDMHLMEPNIA